MSDFVEFPSRTAQIFFSSGEFGYLDQSRSSHQGCCIKNTAHKSFAIFIGKHMLETLFNKATGLQACNFMKKRLEYRCFPVNIAKFLRAPILKNICERLLLSIGQRLSLET